VTPPLLIVYGNCQTEALQAIFRTLPLLTESFEIRHASSFNPELPGQPTAEEAARCTLLFEQHERGSAYPLREALPSTCEIVTFPSIDCNLLWPWNAINPLSTPEPPRFPHGRFPYGDAIAQRRMDEGMEADAILEYYFTRAWEEQPAPMERLLALEHARMEAREKQCDVRMGAYIFDRFRDTRLHWTSNHPSTIALCELTLRLLRAVLPEAEDIERSELVYRVRLLLGEPLGQIGVPIHPEVAKALSLRWYREDMTYPYYGGEFTREEYLQAFIEHAVSQRRELVVG
jgi:hypothetical protein